MLAPDTIQTRALDILDAALVDVKSGKNARLIFTMPPQEGKSQRVSRWFPLWFLINNPEARIVVVSYAHGLARRWGQAVRDEIDGHPEIGLKIRADAAAAHEWRLDGHRGGMITVGVGAGLTGRPADLMIIDDPLSGQQDADSDTMRENLKLWWRGTGSTRLSPMGRVVIVQTRWHEDDLAGWLYTEQPKRWRKINIPAQADHDPDAGETDILDRRPGEFMVSAQGRSLEDWEQRKEDAGSRGWTAVYQGNPTPLEGGIFKRAWWHYAQIEQGIRRSDGTVDAPGFDQLIISVDATFKDSKHSDFVVMQVWGKRGSRCSLLDQVRGRWDFPTTCTQLELLAAKWPKAGLKLIEDKANGPAIIAQLRTKVPGLVPFTPVDSKEARANAVAPFVEAGNVELPNPQVHKWVNEFVDECAAFGSGGKNDDMVDTMTQALHRLLLGSKLSTFVDQLKNGG